MAEKGVVRNVHDSLDRSPIVAAEALVHYTLLLTAFQVAAAVAILLGSTATRTVRGLAAGLIGANAILTLTDGLAEVVPAFPLRYLGVVADAPTPQLIALLVIWFPKPRWGRRERLAATAVLAALAVAAAAIPAVRPETRHEPWYGETFFYASVLLSYAFAVGLLSRDLLRSPSWEVEWMLAAFLLRGADFAARFASAFDDGWRWQIVPPIVLLSTVVLATGAILLRRSLPAELRLVVASVVTGGALFGVLGSFSRGAAAGYHESLVTLSVGRPALMMIALLKPGAIAPFFRGALLGTCGYVAAVGLSRILVLFPPNSTVAEAAFALAVSPAVVASWWYHERRRSARQENAPAIVEGATAAPARADGTAETLLKFLSSLPPGATASRAEVADAVGVLPRNVHRVVEAANRSAFARPGSPLVTWTIRRGRGNQLQYHYALADETRPPIEPERAPVERS